jgi:hypothetical protein
VSRAAAGVAGLQALRTEVGLDVRTAGSARARTVSLLSIVSRIISGIVSGVISGIRCPCRAGTKRSQNRPDSATPGAPYDASSCETLGKNLRKCVEAIVHDIPLSAATLPGVGFVEGP